MPMGKRRRPQKPNATGRSDTSRFVRLDHRILTSNAYRGLTPNGRALLVELVMLFNGENNGSLYMGVQDAAHRMGVADHHAASRAFEELQVLGFIEMTQDASFNVKTADKSRARCWRLTWQAGPGRKAPSWNFLDREPEPQTPARKRMERGLRALKAYRKSRDQKKFAEVDFTTITPISTKLPSGAVVDSTTLNHRNGGKLPNECMVESHHHIAIPWGSAAQRPSVGWWQPECSSLIANWVFLSVVARIEQLPSRRKGRRMNEVPSKSARDWLRETIGVAGVRFADELLQQYDGDLSATMLALAPMPSTPLRKDAAASILRQMLMEDMAFADKVGGSLGKYEWLRHSLGEGTA